jgi:hypothetical protein
MGGAALTPRRTNLIISFMPNQYAYFVFRAISGIFGAATVSELRLH